MERALEEIDQVLADIKFGKVIADADTTISNRCPECGSYRIDGQPPQLHLRGCQWAS